MAYKVLLYFLAKKEVFLSFFVLLERARQVGRKMMVVQVMEMASGLRRGMD